MATEHERIVQEIEAVERRWAAAEQRGDATALEPLLADDFVGIGPRGFTLTKEQWLGRYTSGDIRYDAFHWDESHVRPYGDTAVATGRLSQAGTYQGRDVSGQFRGTQVFVRQAGQWRLAGLHLSPLAEAPGQRVEA